MEYIRNHYGVPAKRGGRVVYTGGRDPIHGTIVGTSGPHLKIRTDDGKTGCYHPTWEIEYL